MPADEIIFQCSVFKNKNDNQPQFRSAEWTAVVAGFTVHKERPGKDGRLWSPATYGNGASRGNAGVDFLHAAVGDFDKGVPFAEIAERFNKYEYVVHSTHSHVPGHPKYRVIIPFSCPVPKEDWAKIKARIDEHVFGSGNDPGAKDAARIYYFPSCPPGAERFSEHHKGEWLDPYELPEASHSEPETILPRKDASEGERGPSKVPLGKVALDFVANGAPMGEQRRRALAAARNYLSAGYSVDETAAAIWRGLQASPQDPDRGPWTHDDAEFIARNLDDSESPALEFADIAVPPRAEIYRVGLGYSCVFPSVGITITIDHLRRNSDGLKGEITVRAMIPSVPVDLHWGNLTLSTTSSRSSLAKYLKERSGGIISEEQWKGILEDVCRKVAFTERQGEPFMEVGMLPGEAATTWLVKNFVPKNEATTIFGEGGSGKSMLALALALSVHTGIELVPGYTPLEKGSVLYLDWETSHIRLNQRVKALVAGRGLEPTQIGYRRCVAAMADQVEEVLRYCQEKEVKLVVIDSVEMAMVGTRENGDANEAILRLHSALRVLKATTLLVDHVSKATGKETGKRNPYGGIFKTNLARMEYELRKAGENPDDKLHMALINTKRNDEGSLFKTVGLRLEFEFDTARYRTDEITDPDLVTTLKYADRIAMGLRYGKRTVRELVAETHIPEATLRSVLSRMHTKGLVYKEGKDREGEVQYAMATDRTEGT